MQTVPQIRIFLASPGDVNEERAVALEVLDMLEYDPLFKRDGVGGGVSGRRRSPARGCRLLSA
jgi:hypothetical protein